MDNEPASVGLSAENDRLYLKLPFFAGVGPLTAVDGVDQYGRVAEQPEFQDACIDRKWRYETALLCQPTVPS